MSGTLQLVGGSVPSEGRVEICLGGNWTTICGYPSWWNTTNAAVICRQLGFNSSGNNIRWISLLTKGPTSPDAEMVYSGIFGQGTGISLQIQARCVGNEVSFLQCPPWNYYIYYYHTCSNHMLDIGVKCESGMWRSGVCIPDWTLEFVLEQSLQVNVRMVMLGWPMEQWDWKLLKEGWRYVMVVSGVWLVLTDSGHGH